MEQIVDTLYKSNHLVITNKEAVIISYIDFFNILGTVVETVLINIIIFCAYVMLRGIDKMYDKSFKRDKNLRKGLIMLSWFTWTVNLFFLISIPGYSTSWLLHIMGATILIYELLKIFTLLGKVGFAPVKFIKIFNAMLKAIFNKNANAVTDLLDELSNDEKFMKSGNQETLPRKRKTPPKTLTLIFMLFIPSLFLFGSKVKNLTDKIEEYEIIEAEKYRTINLVGVNRNIVYTVKWVKINEKRD